MELKLSLEEVLEAIQVYLTLKGYKPSTKCTYLLQSWVFKGATIQVEPHKYDSKDILKFLELH